MPTNPDGSPSQALLDVQTTLRHLVIATYVLYGLVLLVMVAVGVLAALSFASAKTNHDALCAERASHIHQIRETNAFLSAHPGPHPFPGVTREQLQQGVVAQEATVASLDALHC